MSHAFELAKHIAEVVAVFGIVFVFLIHPSVRDLWTISASRRVLVPITLFFMITAFVQVTTTNQYYYPQSSEKFPFTRWAMFAGFTYNAENVQFYDWCGVTRRGERVELNPAKLFLAPNATVHFTKTNSLGNALDSADADRVDFARRSINGYSDALVKRHNQLNPRQEIVAVELWRRTVELKPGVIVPEPFRASACDRLHVYEATYK